MNPNQQLPPQPNQYDFILNPQQPSQQRMFGGGSMKSRIMIVAALLLVIIVAAIVVSSLISASRRGPIDKLKAISAQQTEIIRVAEIGEKNSKSVDGRSFAATVKYSVMTDQGRLAPLLQTAGVKLTPIEQASKKNENVDASLEAAANNNRYDEELKSVLTTYLKEYQTLLQQAYDGGAGPNTKAELERSYDSASAITGTES